MALLLVARCLLNGPGRLLLIILFTLRGGCKEASIRVQRIAVETATEANQLLLRLDPTDYRLAVESGEAELAAAKSSQAQAMADDASRRTRSFPENECLAP
jgi:hypothetical protein